jgi:hypothetical protein
MSAVPTRCPKCNGEMVQGFIWHATGPTRLVSSWVEGAPEKTSWLFQESTKVPKDKCVPVGAFRCSACGFVESYARPEFAAQ